MVLDWSFAEDDLDAVDDDLPCSLTIGTGASAVTVEGQAGPAFRDVDVQAEGIFDNHDVDVVIKRSAFTAVDEDPPDANTTVYLTCALLGYDATAFVVSNRDDDPAAYSFGLRKI